MEGKPPAATHSAAAAQAALELQPVPELRKQLEAFRQAAYERWRAAGQWEGPEVYLPEDKKELERREEEISRHYQRAAQLDPTCEATAYEAAVAAMWAGRRAGPAYASNRQTVDVFTRFLDTFPNSKHAPSLTLEVSDAYSRNAHYLTNDVTGDSVNLPRGVEREGLIKEYRERAMVYMIRHLGLVYSAMAKPGGAEPALDFSGAMLTERMRWFQIHLDEYAATGISEAEFEEVAAEYSRTLDSFPQRMPPGDFQRLRYLAAKKKRQAYADLLSKMQRRWPNPKDVHWTLGKDRAIEDLSDLFQTDPRGTSFYRWLRGKGGPGDLP